MTTSFSSNVLKKDVIPAAQCVIACRPGTSGAVAAVFRKCFSADFSPEIPGDASAFPCICMRCRCACIITTVSGTAGRTISNRIQGTPPVFAVLQQSHSNRDKPQHPFGIDPLSLLPRHHNALHTLIQHLAQHADRLLKLLVLFFIKLNLNDLLQTPGSDNTWQA